MKPKRTKQASYVDEFISELRTKAEDFRKYGDEVRANMCELHANDLEAKRATYLGEELSIAQAAAESGFSERQLKRLRTAGVITLRRGDLPRRPGHGVERGPRRHDSAAAVDGPDIASRVLGARRTAAGSAR